MELDLDQPLVPHIYVRGHKMNLEYEGLHLIFFSMVISVTRKSSVWRCLS